ncbi:MAG TPA: potassium channel family protein [Solirubrobacteraceae bacterium]|nr:potassium channel family protein [Solirubrobacteraceae bacterium]
MTERSEHMAKRFEMPILVAALLVIPVIVVEESNPSPAVRTLANTLNWLIWAAFLAEFVAMLWVASDRRHWLQKHPLEVAIVVFTGPFLPASLQAARAFRVLRVLRLLRLIPSARRVFSLDGLRFAAVLTGLVILGGGAAFHALENNHNGIRISLWDGVWWASSTATTVGANDIYPHTNGGRILAIAIMLFGVGFVALLTGAVAQRFLAPNLGRLAEGEAQIEQDIASVETDLCTELRAIAHRITEIERRIETGANPS